MSSIGQLALVHQAEDGNIWMLDTDAGPGRPLAPPKRILASTRMEESPSIRSDGKQIAFASNRSGYSEIWTARIDGSDAMQVTFLHNPVTGSPDWSPDARKLVFDSRAGGRPQLYIMSADRGRAEPIVSGDGGSVVPHWSRDASQIYLSSDRTGRMEIWRVPASGGVPVQVTKEGGFAAMLSPDGKSIYYTRDNEAVSALWRLDLASGAHKLISPSVLHRANAPQAAGIYFFSGSIGEERSSLCWFDARSEHTTQIFTTPKRIGNGITLAPDGRTLFYTQLDTSDRQLLLVQDFWK